MTSSDWGDWLPRAVADADPAGVSLWYLGCNGFAVKGSGGTTLWIDPYLGTGDPPRTVRMIPVPFDAADVRAADAVLATHEHTDHVHGPSQAPILANTGAAFVAPDDSLAVARSEGWADDYSVDPGQYREVTAGDSLELGGFEVDVVEVSDPDATHPVGYVLRHDAGTVFHGGDTKPASGFAALGERYDVDLALLAFGSVGPIADKETGEPRRTRWYNDENEIIEIANDLRADRLLPTHWDMWRGLTADPTALHRHAAGFDHPRSLTVAEIGDRVDV